MKSTPPYAFFRASLVFGAVCPTYWPTRSSRVTETRCPRSTYPSRWRIAAMRRATVVFPVPGLPVKHMCSDGRSDASPCSRRRRSTTSSAPVALPGRGVRRVGMQAIVHGAVAPVRPLEAEARLVARTVDDEAQRRRLPAVARVVGDHLDVVVGELLAAGRDLAHRNPSLAGRQVEQRQVPHLPVRVPRMRVVRVLDRDRPAVAERVPDLRLDLLVGEVRKEGEGALCDSHRRSPVSQPTVGVNATSGVSVDSNSKVMSFHTSRAAFSSGQPFAALARMSGPSWK